MKELIAGPALLRNTMTNRRSYRWWLGFLLPAPIILGYSIVGFLYAVAAVLPVEMSINDRLIGIGYFAWAVGGFWGWFNLQNISMANDRGIRHLVGLLCGVFAVGAFLGLWGFYFLRDLGHITVAESAVGCWPVLLAPMQFELIAGTIRCFRSLATHRINQ